MIERGRWIQDIFGGRTDCTCIKLDVGVNHGQVPIITV